MAATATSAAPTAHAPRRPEDPPGEEARPSPPAQRRSRGCRRTARRRCRAGAAGAPRRPAASRGPRGTSGGEQPAGRGHARKRRSPAHEPHRVQPGAVERGQERVEAHAVGEPERRRVLGHAGQEHVALGHARQVVGVEDRIAHDHERRRADHDLHQHGRQQCPERPRTRACAAPFAQGAPGPARGRGHDQDDRQARGVGREPRRRWDGGSRPGPSPGRHRRPPRPNPCIRRGRPGPPSPAPGRPGARAGSEPATSSGWSGTVTRSKNSAPAAVRRRPERRRSAARPRAGAGARPGSRTTRRACRGPSEPTTTPSAATTTGPRCPRSATVERRRPRRQVGGTRRGRAPPSTAAACRVRGSRGRAGPARRTSSLPRATSAAGGGDVERQDARGRHAGDAGEDQPAEPRGRGRSHAWPESDQARIAPVANADAQQVIATNRKAFFNYEILDRAEAGVLLRAPR